MSSDTTSERLAELETEFLGLVNVASPTRAMRDRIHRLVTIVAREAYTLALTQQGVGSIESLCPQREYLMGIAARQFPLPPKRVLREEPDPHEFGTVWMARTDGGVERGIAHNGVVFKPTSSSAVPTVERIALWADLVARTYREVPDNVDE